MNFLNVLQVHDVYKVYPTNKIKMEQNGAKIPHTKNHTPRACEIPCQKFHPEIHTPRACDLKIHTPRACEWCGTRFKFGFFSFWGRKRVFRVPWKLGKIVEDTERLQKALQSYLIQIQAGGVKFCTRLQVLWPRVLSFGEVSLVNLFGF